MWVHVVFGEGNQTVSLIRVLSGTDRQRLPEGFSLRCSSAHAVGLTSTPHTELLAVVQSESVLLW